MGSFKRAGSSCACTTEIMAKATARVLKFIFLIDAEILIVRAQQRGFYRSILQPDDIRVTINIDFMFSKSRFIRLIRRNFKLPGFSRRDVSDVSH
jgi:uncharacterized pyridoxamine 5'-phosphate oxidase family protein